jgi:hypothetical protein
VVKREEELERRIVRHLDGELSASEQTELYRMVLRDPALHRTLDAYTEHDRVAAEALRRVCGGDAGTAAASGAAGSLLPGHGGAASEGPAIGRQTVSGTRRGATWVGLAAANWSGWVGAAAAVALLASVTWTMALHGPRGRGASDARLSRGGNAPPAARTVAAADMQTALRPVLRDPVTPAPLLAAPHGDQSLRDRSVIGVFDDAENRLYLWEVERQETQVQVVKADL